MARLTGLPKRLGSLPGAVGGQDRAEAERVRNRARSGGGSLRKLYSCKRWRDLRQDVAEAAAWMCQGCDVPHQLNEIKFHPDSLTVDHKTPHKGNLVLFWDVENLQAVCKRWHDTEKQKMEQAAHATGQGEGWV